MGKVPNIKVGREWPVGCDLKVDLPYVRCAKEIGLSTQPESTDVVWMECGRNGKLRATVRCWRPGWTLVHVCVPDVSRTHSEEVR